MHLAAAASLSRVLRVFEGVNQLLGMWWVAVLLGQRVRASSRVTRTVHRVVEHRLGHELCLRSLVLSCEHHVIDTGHLRLVRCILLQATWEKLVLLLHLMRLCLGQLGSLSTWVGVHSHDVGEALCLSCALLRRLLFRLVKNRSRSVEWIRNQACVIVGHLALTLEHIRDCLVLLCLAAVPARAVRVRLYDISFGQDNRVVAWLLHMAALTPTYRVPVWFELIVQFELSTNRRRFCLTVIDQGLLTSTWRFIDLILRWPIDLIRKLDTAFRVCLSLPVLPRARLNRVGINLAQLKCCISMVRHWIIQRCLFLDKLVNITLFFLSCFLKACVLLPININELEIICVVCKWALV